MKPDQRASATLLGEFSSRGLVQQCSDESRLAQHLAGGTRTLYCGFDPTADSLHLGNLLQLVTLRRFQIAGHRPILLVGGATGLIGDPSGKAGERALEPADVVAARAERVRAQMERVIDAEQGAIFVDNRDWLGPLGAISFLRDFGKHVQVNVMLDKESVRSRLTSGVSFTEFSYMLLQAIDFLELRRRHDCTLQIGGSDQWGNITAGIDLVRRVDQAAVFGLTLPLLTRADGAKLGKTEQGAIWLDPALTPPFAFYQYLLNTSDGDAPRLLMAFSLRPVAEIQELVAEARRRPKGRDLQRALARELTELVHGEGGRSQAERISDALFGLQGFAHLSESEWSHLAAGTPTIGVEREHLGRMTLADLIATCGLAPSKSHARALCAAGAVWLMGERVTDPLLGCLTERARFGQFLLIRRGSKTYHLVRVED